MTTTSPSPRDDAEAGLPAEIAETKDILDYMESEDRVLDAHDRRRKKMALWVAVAGTTAFIAALWVMLLPLTLRDNVLFSGDDGRWQQTGPDAGSESKSFGQVMDEIREKIEFADQDLRRSEASDAARFEVQRLRDRIESREGGYGNVNQ